MSSADEQPWILGIRASHTAPSVCCTATRSSSRSRRNVSLESSDIAFTAGPSLATAYCLDYAGIDPSQLDLVVLCVQGRLQDEVHDLRRDPFLNVTLHDTRNAGDSASLRSRTECVRDFRSRGSGEPKLRDRRPAPGPSLQRNTHRLR